MKRISLWCVTLFTCFYFSAQASSSARMMVHLLDYIAVDYSMAVQEGAVISEAEYAEMLEFVRTVSSLSAQSPSALQSDVLLLQKLIDEKASPVKVAAVANKLKKATIEHYKIEVAPVSWPKISSGEALFATHCQSCHGKSGLGDGPLAPGLEPKPTNFHQPDKANGLSPFQAYNTIRLGVDGTAMRAFDELSEEEVWDLAFYVLSLPHRQKITEAEARKMEFPVTPSLEQLASSNNQELEEALSLSTSSTAISAMRLFPLELFGAEEGDHLAKAKMLLNQSVDAYAAGDSEGARTLALAAYLEGVEPMEVQLRANDASLVGGIEASMGAMRSAIENDRSVEEVRGKAELSLELLDKASLLLNEKSFSAWFVFLLSSTIILREGLEAFLVIITILGIMRSLNMKGATNWIHGGWISAIALGFVLWLAADKLFTFKAAQREIMEGAIALFAVGVLLYVGFWMHSKSEAGKWQAYVKSKIQGLAKKENMLGLSFLAFLVVFREAFESVLFLSALNVEVEEGDSAYFVGGIFAAFALLAVISVLLLRYSKKLPITKLFRISAIIISVLAVILAGKGIHALQEAGVMSINSLPISLRSPLIGLYPSWQTLLTQLAVVALIVVLWNIGNKPVQQAVRTEPAKA